jgi:hypothetical protein
MVRGPDYVHKAWAWAVFDRKACLQNNGIPDGTLAAIPVAKSLLPKLQRIPTWKN